MVVSGEKRETVEAAREEDITNSILKVTREQDKVIYFTKGHNEADIENEPGGAGIRGRQAGHREPELPCAKHQSGRGGEHSRGLLRPGDRRSGRGLAPNGDGAHRWICRRGGGKFSCCWTPTSTPA